MDGKCRMQMLRTYIVEPLVTAELSSAVTFSFRAARLLPPVHEQILAIPALT